MNQQHCFSWKGTRAQITISCFPQHKGRRLCYSSCEKPTNNAHTFITHRYSTWGLPRCLEGPAPRGYKLSMKGANPCQKGEKMGLETIGNPCLPLIAHDHRETPRFRSVSTKCWHFNKKAPKLFSIRIKSCGYQPLSPLTVTLWLIFWL